MKIYTINSKFTSGKYKNKRVVDIITSDPEYIQKCLEGKEDIEFDMSQELWDIYIDNLHDIVIEKNVETMKRVSKLQILIQN